ncbi:major facilitator superfamily domain-containing protein [Apodospora peruviana]|uniref:Major facilitator superfamily domain-containing protein n=1 Tax=Apodospora peruviana TaxID=516989 RepID=A0AAE0M1U6_9PEZI|nr:major facilitator superfamily domain-containing protein [Apodospora peruviana]
MESAYNESSDRDGGSESNPDRLSSPTHQSSIPMATAPSPAADREPKSHVQSSMHDVGIVYPSGWRLWLMGTALCLGGFLVSFDSTVLATAVPVISDEFSSLGDIGWYSSVYFLAMCAPQLVLAKLNDRYPVRWNYAMAMLLFVMGSALCGAAPNSPALIVGRCLAGLGSSGLLVSTSALVPFLAPPAERPVLFGFFAGAMGLGIGSGPLLGGVLTQNVTWRWNFYMNIPIGAFIYVVFYMFVHPPPPERPTSFIDFVKTLDLVGLAAFTPSVTCLLLALQWGGTKYAWNDRRIIVLLVVFGILAIIFSINEFWQGDNAMFPGRVFSQRSVQCAVWFCFCSNGASIVLTYYLPIWFQGVRGDSPILSGVHTLALVITTVIATIVGGLLIALFGHVAPWMVAASVFTAIGAGLLTTLDVGTVTSKWLGYQIIYGLGSAFGRNCPSICLQNLLPEKDAPMGYTIITFVSFVSGAVFVSIAQALFANNLVVGLEGLGLSHHDAAASLAGGIKSITDGLSEEMKELVAQILNKSIVDAWRLPVVLSCFGIIGALSIEHNKVNVKPKLGI